jgi:hypothetical protein
MATGPPEAGRPAGLQARLTRSRGRTGSPPRGGRYGLLLAVLVGTYLLAAFSAAKLAPEVAYLMVGLMFASGYAALQHLATSDFFADHQPANTQTFQYFSFTTLTTLGYGDFTAAQSDGRSIAVLEALTGQVFMATLVARLVSAYRGPARPGRRLPQDVDGSGDDEDRDHQ